MLRARWTPRRRPSRLTQSSSDGCFLSPSLSPAALMGSRVLPAAQPPPDSCESPTPQGQAQRRARGSPEQKCISVNKEFWLSNDKPLRYLRPYVS